MAKKQLSEQDELNRQLLIELDWAKHRSNTTNTTILEGGEKAKIKIGNFECTFNLKSVDELIQRLKQNVKHNSKKYTWQSPMGLCRGMKRFKI